DPVGRPGVVGDHLDVGLGTEGRDPRRHAVAHHLERRAAEERGRQLDVHALSIDLHVADDAEVDERDDRDLGVLDLFERRPDLLDGDAQASALRSVTPGLGTGAPTYWKSLRATER